MPRTGAAAVRYAKDHHSFHTGMCQMWTRLTFDVGARDGTAALCWWRSPGKHHTTDPGAFPPAVAAYWLGGRKGFGHAAPTIGSGLIRSTDWPGSGRIGTARLTSIAPAWGLRLVGWASVINGVTIWTPPHGVLDKATAKPDPHVIDLSNVRAATRARSEIANGIILKKAVAEEVGAGAMSVKHRGLGPSFRNRYRLVQREYLRTRGITRPAPADVDGIPGYASLRWLCRRHELRMKV